ncbi:MAG: allantoinase PuuE [Rhodobacteraceae bacterium]|nr:allantoinase PuuE [Paracoccaceae bacterium]
MKTYPRDLRGYGQNPIDPEWPGGAVVALQFVVNFEEGGENCLLHGDSASEAFLSEIVGAEAWQGQRHWNMESIYEYGSRAGFWRLRRVFAEAGVPVTVFGVATALARSPEPTAAMLESGWEIASHGLKWIEYKDFTESEERASMREAIDLHTEVTGKRPLGWYTGRCSENTLRLVAEEGGFSYCSDSYADDLPYWVRIGGRNQLILPYTLDANDMRFATAQGFNSGEQFFAYLRDSLDLLHAEGREGAPKMMSVGLHCRLAGRPGRAQALKRFLNYANALGGVWFARRIDIARHWMAVHAPPGHGLRPSEMGADEFVRHFGAVFEHSEWVAANGYAMEVGPAHDCPEGVHSLLCRAFRAAGSEARLAVLKAHPDLAGKLAQARRLTTDSASEQASAGLDVMTDGERAEFTELNRRYREKFGIPFIIAVRDHSRQSILEIFGARLKNDPQQEFEEACRQVERIAWHRLAAKFG